jgi:hypothetical protein
MTYDAKDSSRDAFLGMPNPHFGSNEEMLVWCEREGLTVVKDSRGDYDWQAVWDAYLARTDVEES